MSRFQRDGDRKHASLTVRIPLARTDDLLIEEIEDEVLIYDQRSDRVHCLSFAAAGVWRGCDGMTTVEQLSVALALDTATVAGALEELAACELLDNGPVSGVTRREAGAKLARYGAAAASAPLIYSIIAPTPALATTDKTCEAMACVADCSTCVAAGCACCHGNSCGNCSNGGHRLCIGNPPGCTGGTAPCTTANINTKCGCNGANACTGTPDCRIIG